MQDQSWRNARYTDENLAGMVFENCRFESVVFESMDLLQTVFVNCRFDDCRFLDCQMGAAVFTKCFGTGVAIAGGLLRETAVSGTEWETLVIERTGLQFALTECKFRRLDFNGEGAEQRSLTLSGVEVERLKAENAVWMDGTLVGMSLAACEFLGARFERTSFIQAKGRELDLSTIRLLSCNLYQSDFSGSRIRQAEKSIFAESTLEATDFSDAELQGCLFAKANAAGACFDRARLRGALFPDANLAGASFVDALAPNSVWTGASLVDARLRGMDARQGIFRNADLQGADVTGANFTETELHGVQQNLEDADTRDARGTIDWRAEMEQAARQR